MDSINLNMRSVEVSFETRALRSTYTKEIAFEVSTFESIDSEAELAKHLSYLLSLERTIHRKKSIKNIYKEVKTS